MLIIFLFLVIICFTLPGIYFLKKSKALFSFWEKIILGTVTGLIFFTLLSYILKVAGIHFLLLPIIFIIAFLALKQISFKFNIPHFSKKILLLIITITLGVIGQLLVIAPSGTYLNGDLVFWSSHGHDGLWHLSLMNEYNKNFPLQNPVLAGERLVNYHFFSDIAPADFNNYFKLPTLDLYFRFFPLIFSLLLGGLAYLLGKKIGGGFQSGLWATIFTYFAGSFGYIVTFLQSHSIGGESLFWASQIQSSIGNPPQIAAFLIVLTFLYLFSIYLYKENAIIFFICVMLAGSLAVFKVYGAVVILASLGLVGLWQLIKERKIKILLLFFSSAALSAILYLPNSQNSGSFLIWEPWWFIRTMVVAPDKLNWLDLELRRQTYISEGNLKRVIQLETTAFLIFFFGNLGIRFLGLFYLPKFFKKIFTDYFKMIIGLIIIISFLLPLFFLQKGVASNTIQFLQYYLLLLGILSAITVSEIFKRLKSIPLRLLIGFIILILAIPTQLALINSFYNRLPFAKIEKSELDSLKFLKDSTDDKAIILTPPYNKYFNLNNPIPNIWDWSDTSYVASLSGRKTYLEDTEQVDIMNYNFKDRLTFQESIFKIVDPESFKQQLLNKKIDYLYFPKLLAPQVNLEKTNLRKIFSNSSVEIWKVVK